MRTTSNRRQPRTLELSRNCWNRCFLVSQQQSPIKWVARDSWPYFYCLSVLGVIRIFASVNWPWAQIWRLPETSVSKISSWFSLNSKLRITVLAKTSSSLPERPKSSWTTTRVMRRKLWSWALRNPEQRISVLAKACSKLTDHTRHLILPRGPKIKITVLVKVSSKLINQTGPPCKHRRQILLQAIRILMVSWLALSVYNHTSQLPTVDEMVNGRNGDDQWSTT
jgi:hypothetical protein